MKTKDIFDSLYTGFLLRDFLGYVVPGSFILFCVLHFIGLVDKNTQSIFIQLIDNKTVYVIFMAASYACGHFISGAFFHSQPFKNIFVYSPTKELSNNYPGDTPNDAWVSHRYKFATACASGYGMEKGRIERHKALVHFTGHFSASLIFVAFYIVGVAIYMETARSLLYAFPLALISTGVYAHYRRLVYETFRFEIEVIKSAQSQKTSPPSKRKARSSSIAPSIAQNDN